VPCRGPPWASSTALGVVIGLVVGLGVVGWQAGATAPAPPAGPRERVKWEYKVLNEAGGDAEHARPTVPRAKGRWETDEPAERLARLGEDGWELAAVHEPAGPQVAMSVFKRLK